VPRVQQDLTALLALLVRLVLQAPPARKVPLVPQEPPARKAPPGPQELQAPPARKVPLVVQVLSDQQAQQAQVVIMVRRVLRV
jgi:hypothetical protein